MAMNRPERLYVALSTTAFETPFWVTEHCRYKRTNRFTSYLAQIFDESNILLQRSKTCAGRITLCAWTHALYVIRVGAKNSEARNKEEDQKH